MSESTFGLRSSTARRSHSSADVVILQTVVRKEDKARICTAVRFHLFDQRPRLRVMAECAERETEALRGNVLVLGPHRLEHRFGLLHIALVVERKQNAEYRNPNVTLPIWSEANRGIKLAIGTCEVAIQTQENSVVPVRKDS